MDRHGSSSAGIVAVLLGLGFMATPVLAGTDSWTAIGQPPGAGIHHVVVDPAAHQVAYAATTSGLFMSTDSGGHWARVFAPFSLSGGDAFDVALEPEAHQVLYVAAGSSGVYVSQDGGATWTQSNTGITGLGPLAPEDWVQYVSADPVNDGTAYASTIRNGIYKTTDHGKHWTAVNSGFPTPFINTTSSFLFGRVIVDPTNAQTLYLPLGEQGPFMSGDGVYQSTDGGASWHRIFGSLEVQHLFMDPHNSANLYVIDTSNILYYITGTGSYQTGTFTQPPQPTSIAVDPSNDQNMMAGTLNSGLYVSSNGGGSWSPAGSSAALDVQDVVMDPTAPATLYVGTQAFGIYTSTDNGATLAAGSGLFGPQGSTLIMGSDRVLYMGTEFSGVLKSNDQGASWAFANTGISGDGASISTQALVQDPTTPATLYVSTSDGTFKTTDGGASWSALPIGTSISIVGSLAIDPENTQTLYAGYGLGVYKSVDGGTSWNPVSPGLPGGPVVLALAVDPTDSNLVYAGTEQNGIYKSSDAGAHWSLLNSGIGNQAVLAIGIDPFDHQDIYAAGPGVLKSTDGGAHWTSLSFDLFTSGQYDRITFDPVHSGTVYVSSSSTPVVCTSTDGGANWTLIGDLFGGNTLNLEGIRTIALDTQNPATIFGAGGDGQFYAFGVQAPAAMAETLSVQGGAATDGKLAYNLPGFTGTVRFAIVVQPTHGTVSITDATTGAYTYRPAAGFSGQDSFTYSVSAAAATSVPATVSVTVTASTPSNPSTGGGSSGGGGVFSLLSGVLLFGLLARRRITAA